MAGTSPSGADRRSAGAAVTRRLHCRCAVNRIESCTGSVNNSFQRQPKTMSDPAISYRASLAAANPRRRLLLAGLFILLSIGLCNVAARVLNMESSRNQLHAWALDPGHGWADSWDP